MKRKKKQGIYTPSNDAVLGIRVNQDPRVLYTDRPIRSTTTQTHPASPSTRLARAAGPGSSTRVRTRQPVRLDPTFR